MVENASLRESLYNMQKQVMKLLSERPTIPTNSEVIPYNN